MTDIRYTQEEDWQELKRVRLAALLDAPTAFGVTHASAAAYTDEAWRDRAAGRGKARFILAFEGAEAVGIVGHVPNDRQELELIAMWVAPSYRGTSIAAQLVDAVKRDNLTYTRILLDVARSNQRASAFYQKQGFVFLPQWEPLESHPHIQLQKMEWKRLTGTELEDKASSFLGKLLFVFSRIELELALAVSESDAEGNAFSHRLKLFRSMLLSQGEDAEGIAWCDRMENMRDYRNRFAHGRWGILHLRQQIAHVVGYPSGEQREDLFSLAALSAILDEATLLERDLKILRKRLNL
jgi:ribosomal protein S18 acetylase RimI-like enzyme